MARSTPAQNERGPARRTVRGPAAFAHEASAGTADRRARKAVMPPVIVAPIRELDLNDVGISSVVWATGFRYDFGWIDLPIFVETGTPSGKRPIHRCGVTDIPGLYFIGLQWLSTRKSSLMAGVGEDAAFLADHVVSRT